MRNRINGFTISGIVLLIGVILFLSSSPQQLFSPVATFIDTELYRLSGQEVSVQTKTDFGSPENVAAFPMNFGKWEGHEYDTTQYVDFLGADVMLLRGYEPITFSQPVFFLILQASTESSFHSPQWCVRAQGHELQEEGIENIIIENAAWVKESATLSIPFGKLIVLRRAKDKTVLERRALLFCYVKGNQFTTDTITMIQIEALAPFSGSYEGTLNEEKEFLSQAIPLLFEPGEEENWHPIATDIIELGLSGYIIVGLILLIPVLVIVFPILRRRKGY